MSMVLDRPIIENKIIKKYDIWMIEMRDGIGSEQKGVRPCAVISNNIGNKYSPTILVAPLTSSESKNKIPTHVTVGAKTNGLTKSSIALLEQVVAIDKRRLKYKICELDDGEKNNIDVALMISFGLQLA